MANRRVVRWVVWLDDERVFDSDDTEPEQVPADGIQVIVEFFDNGTYRVWSEHDYYLWTGEHWIGGDLAALERWLRRELPRLKYGRFTTDSQWVAALTAAQAHTHGSKLAEPESE